MPDDLATTPEPQPALADTLRVREAPPPIRAPQPPVTPRPPGPMAQALRAFGPWLQKNWFYAVSAASLALAGIFLVEYGMEAGLLPPRARVAAALGFGAALIAAGEWIRRRFGDDVSSATAYLPSVFSGAGIVTLFGAVLSARMLYDLIGGMAGMAGMGAVALIAIVLGWMHGPLLVAVGVVGAFAAPVVLDSSPTDASPLLVYFAVVAVLGLGVDTVRRWAWISALTLVLAYAMGALLSLSLPAQSMWAAIVYFSALPVMAVLIPSRRIWPDHAGPPATIGALARLTSTTGRGLTWPGFPTVLSFICVAVSAVLLVLLSRGGAGESWLSLSALAALTLALILWSNRAPGLQDQPLLTGAALLGAVILQGFDRGSVYLAFARTYADTPEAAFPWTVTILTGIGALLSGAAAWRALRGGDFAVLWAAFAAVYAPALAIMLEVGWTPSTVIGAYPWALHAAALSAGMVIMAERFARADGADRLRTSFAVMSALSCLVFAFVIVLSSVALTVALACTVVAAAALDRVWNLPPMRYFIAAGVAVLGFRLVLDPGLPFGRTAPLPEFLLAYAGTLLAFLAARVVLRPRGRPLADALLESAAWSAGGLALSLAIFRWIDATFGASFDVTHWSMGLNAAIWLGLALAQLQRMGAGGSLLGKCRMVLAVIFGTTGGAALAVAVTEANPLFADGLTDVVLGPVLLNTLAAAYLLPALVLLAGAWRLRHRDRRLRMALGATGVALAAFWLFGVLRHFWQGGEAMALDHGMTQPELYTYTVVLLTIGAVLFYQSLAQGAPLLRRAGLIVIGLAVAKVFLVDITGLGGLTRVFSLLVLGLSLAALAWLDRWAQGQAAPPAAGAPPPPPP